jgi:hypothetical protein
MVNKYYRKNFKEGTGPAARLGPTARKITKEIAKGITGAVSNKELKFIDSLKAAAKPKKKFKSPMQRQRKLDTLKSEAAKRGSIVMSGEEMQKLKGESDKSFKQRMDKAFKAKKGGRAKMMGGGMMGRRFGMKEGSLKPVDPKTQKGLSKLPTKVRNKMGYMKKGGRA